MATIATLPPPRQPEPAWDIARLFPDQGSWTEADYLDLNTNHLVEFADGCVEVLPMPTMLHQALVQVLSNLLLAFITPGKLGRVLFAPMRVRLWPGRFREPDVVFMLTQHVDRMGNQFWRGADLVMEVVSENEPERDLVTKRQEYAEANIPEYWIIDPRTRRISVLKLGVEGYEVAGEYGMGQRAGSVLLAGFEVDVAAVFKAAEAT